MKTIIAIILLLTTLSSVNRSTHYHKYATVIRHNHKSGLTYVMDKQGTIWTFFYDGVLPIHGNMKLTIYTNNTKSNLDDWVVDAVLED